jgi:hypothetical protein
MDPPSLTLVGRLGKVLGGNVQIQVPLRQLVDRLDLALPDRDSTLKIPFSAVFNRNSTRRSIFNVRKKT